MAQPALTARNLILFGEVQHLKEFGLEVPMKDRKAPGSGAMAAPGIMRDGQVASLIMVGETTKIVQ